MTNKENSTVEPIGEDFFTVANLLIPSNLAIARAELERLYPGQLGDDSIVEDLLNDPDIQRTIEKSVQEEINARQ